MAERNLTAMYDTEAAAHAARDALLRLGIPADAVRVRGQAGAAGAAAPAEDKSFWEEVKSMFGADDDRETYGEGVRRGGHLVSVRVDESKAAQAERALEDADPVDVDSRSESWRKEGWSGGSSATAGSATGGAMANLTGNAGSAAATGGTTRERTTTTTTTGASSSEHGVAGLGAAGLGAGRAGGEETLQTAEEELRVGKREVSRGGVRVRSFVTERPVEESVALREETVHVERRPVDRELRAGDQAFEERSIEMRERGEEAVASKEARVKEEISLRKEADTRTETVRDTVREQHVEVEDERKTGHAHGAGLTGGTEVETTRTTGTDAKVGTGLGATERTTKTTTDRTGR